MDINVDNLLEDLEALRIDIDVECQYCDPMGVLRDKYERANEMLDDCLNIIKEVADKNKVDGRCRW